MESALRKSRVGIMAALAAAMLAGAGAIAQSVDDGSADNPLNLPDNVQIFGKQDPTIRKATAIVNGDIVTDTDVDHRLNLVILANGGKAEGDERDRLRLQVLRNLIDETLEIQEAKANDITIGKDQIDQTFQRVAGQFKQTPASFTAYLAQHGTSAGSMRRQIEGELAWQRVLSRKVEPFVNVGDEEVRQVMARLTASKGAREYHVAEIFLSDIPATQDAVLANANRIVEQLRKGASFPAYARQYSEASTAAVGGDLGWVRAEQLPQQISDTVQAMQPSQLSQPIPLPGGYSIIALVDSRQVLTADPRDAVLSLKQLSIKFPGGMTQTQAAPKVEKLASATKAITGCGGAEKVASDVGAELVQNDDVKIRDLPPQLQDMLLKMSVGQATAPFGSLDDGVRVLVLCGRDDPEQAGGPSFDQIYAQMQDDRVNKRARRYLRDLRRDAVVDYR